MEEKIFESAFMIMTFGALIRFIAGSADVPRLFKLIVMIMIFGGAIGMVVSGLFYIWR